MRKAICLQTSKQGYLKTFQLLGFLFLVHFAQAQDFNKKIRPSRTEIINPIHKKSFNTDTKNSKCDEWKQGGNAKLINGYQVFNGAMDGYRQVDPQIAVGGGYIVHATNNGLIIYKKNGDFVQGVATKCFNSGIDPKLFYDIHNQSFAFDVWAYWLENKPVNISVSETEDPTGAWNTYAIPATNGEDGGGIGYSKKWIGYSYPGSGDLSFVLRTKDAKAGRKVTVYHFTNPLGQPIFVQDDDTDDLYFLEITETNFILRKVSEDANGPYWIKVFDQPHNLSYIDYPPPSPQKGTTIKVASGDRNPKNIVLQNGSIWFSHAVNCNDRSAVQWHQLNLANGAFLQTGLIKSETSNYIQTTLAVNKDNDVLIGFQQVDEKSYISPRFAYRLSGDPKGTIRQIISAGEGSVPTDGESWGDYSGSIIDGDNLFDLWTIQSIANENRKAGTVIIKVSYKKFIEEQQILLRNSVTNRYLLSDGDPMTGKRGDEGGWLKSPAVIGSDANYYNRAIWYLEKNSDGSFFIINSETNRYLFSDGEPIKGERGDEGGWLKSPKIVGTDENYYNRAMWFFEKNSDGSYFIRNKETNRYLFCDGNTFTGKRGKEGTWLKSPKILGTDANYYNRAKWYITGTGVSLIKP